MTALLTALPGWLPWTLLPFAYALGLGTFYLWAFAPPKYERTWTRRDLQSALNKLSGVLPGGFALLDPAEKAALRSAGRL